MDWKDNLAFAYSTNKDYEDSLKKEDSGETYPDISKQNLKIRLDTKLKAGKKLTSIEGVLMPEKELDILLKELKTSCGVGGFREDKIFFIQGDHRERAKTILEKKGFKVRVL